MVRMNIIVIKKVTLFLGDVAFLTLSLPLTLLLAFGKDFTSQTFFAHLYPFLAIYFFILLLFFISGMYDIRSFKSSTSVFAHILIIHVAGMMFGVMFFYLATNPAITPKTNLVLNMITSAVLINIWRILFQRFLASHLKINVAIAGINEHAKELAGIMSARPYMGYNLAAIISTEPMMGGDIFGNVKTHLADITKAKEILNWEPKVSLKEGIGELISNF